MNVIHGESIVRNLLIGRRIGDDFGNTSRVGYTPTSYGQVSQMAQIYGGFGVDGMIFYRGLHDVECDNEYLLEAPDGSRIFGARLSPNVGRGAFYLYVERATMQPDEWFGYEWEEGLSPVPSLSLGADHEEEPRLLVAPFTETWNPDPIPDGVAGVMAEALEATRPPRCSVSSTAWTARPVEVPSPHYRGVQQGQSGLEVRAQFAARLSARTCARTSTSRGSPFCGASAAAPATTRPSTPSSRTPCPLAHVSQNPQR